MNKGSIEELARLASVLKPEDFLQVIADGAKFAEDAEKFEAKLHKKLDKMVANGDLTEHEARWKFYEEFGEFTENSARESAQRIMGKNTDEEEDDDAVDETERDQEDEEESHVDMGDSSGDRSVVDIHIHCHRDDSK